MLQKSWGSVLSRHVHIDMLHLLTSGYGLRCGRQSRAICQCCLRPFAVLRTLHTSQTWEMNKLYNSTDCVGLHHPARLPWSGVQILRHHPKSLPLLWQSSVKTEFGFLYSCCYCT